MTEQLREVGWTIEALQLSYGLHVDIEMTITFRADPGERRTYDNPGCKPYVYDVDFHLNSVEMFDAKGEKINIELIDEEKEDLLTMACDTLTDSDVQDICLNSIVED